MRCVNFETCSETNAETSLGLIFADGVETGLNFLLKSRDGVPRVRASLFSETVSGPGWATPGPSLLPGAFSGRLSVLSHLKQKELPRDLSDLGRLFVAILLLLLKNQVS